MTKPIPNSYPRLYSENLPEPSHRGADAWPGMNKLCQAFERATGWPLECLPGEAPAKDVKLLWSAPDDAVASVGTQIHVGVANGAEDEAPPAPSTQVELPAAVELAATLGELVAELAQLRRAVWRREAELAAQVPISAGRESKQHLADRLEASLTGAAQAAGCEAAALYLLDESTTHLKLRSVCGLPRRRLLEPPRELADANADLEVLLGHAIVLEDTASQTCWRLPEDAASAICVPVCSATIPLGTLWVFGQRPRSFRDAEVNLVEIVAGRIAAELERETLLASGVEGARLQRQWAAAGRWQECQLPHIAPQVAGWQVAGWTRHATEVGGGFFDWFVRDNERLAVAVGRCPGGNQHPAPGAQAASAGFSPSPMEAALAATSLRAALRAHGEHVANPGELIERVNRSLWQRSPGDQSANLFYAVVQPDQERVQYAAAGTIGALVLSPRGVKRLPASVLPLGSDPDARIVSRDATIESDELLLIVSQYGAAGDAAGIDDLATQLLPHLSQPASALSELARDRLTALAPKGDCTALVLKRLV